MISDVIQLLPDSVANQIAAGEVIQRPASVIKELVENAIDAGATDICINVKDGGRTLIQVIDNGCGMSPKDARMAFERHATSKITSAMDLYSLHTMGFRGEALPSIAAVAQIELRTMRHGDSIGTKLEISESHFEGQQPDACQPGTNISVKNLFFHMPARRKFLKKDSVELGHIIHEFERLALVNTHVDFSLYHNDTVLHQFKGGTLKQRIAALFGKNVENHIAPISTETSLVKIEGFIGMPSGAKKRGALQYLFVNGRNMRHPFFHKAILKCYEQLIAPDSQPSYFINFEVDPSTIDVNIHPQKHEIKFEHEAAIWQILIAAVRETLGRNQVNGALDFDSDEAPEIPLFEPQSNVGAPEEIVDEDYNPFRAASDNPPRQSYTSSSYNWNQNNQVPKDWDKLYENFNRQRNDAFLDFAEPELETKPTTPCFQLQNSYIVTSSQQGLMVISQRRAHIRILFERYMALLDKGDMASQKLIFPEDFEISAAQSAVLEAVLPQLSTIGFELQQNGATNWSILSSPAAVEGVSPVELLLAIIDDIPSDVLDRKALQQPLALSMARSAAVKGGRQLSDAEMESVVADLFRCSEPSYTPEGLPVMFIVDNNEISRRFNA